MKIETTIDEEDFLILWLYDTSKSELVNNRRLLYKLLIPVAWLLSGLVSLASELYFACFFFITIGALWYFLYPVFDRKRFIVHYRKQINRYYRSMIDKLVLYEFNTDWIIVKGLESESKINTTKVEGIVELSSVILLNLNSHQSFIFSKSKIKEIAELRIFLKELAAHLNIKYTLDDQWVWK
jgi:hypothetical protein